VTAFGTVSLTPIVVVERPVALAALSCKQPWIGPRHRLLPSPLQQPAMPVNQGRFPLSPVTITFLIRLKNAPARIRTASAVRALEDLTLLATVEAKPSGCRLRRRP
jgi:hypothetical protein